MDEIVTFVKTAIGIAFFICSWLVVRGLLIPLSKKMDNWIMQREVSPEEEKRALEAYPLSKKELEKIAFEERVKAEAMKEEKKIRVNNMSCLNTDNLTLNFHNSF